MGDIVTVLNFLFQFAPFQTAAVVVVVSASIDF
jgi:hypothetical protein